MQACTSLQTDNHANTPPLVFYRPDALPAAQPTASKHWRHLLMTFSGYKNWSFLRPTVFFAMMCCANMLSAVAYTCPSVCLFMSYCVKMAELRIMQTTQYKTPGKQTFCCGDWRAVGSWLQVLGSYTAESFDKLCGSACEYCELVN